ncbi:MAG: pyruvate, water dikinase [Proteobacteria bacterium]|nr:pyruvate, water dikinase [Pseudomonadota bacterium]MBU1710148.1 pyruvate, water dikinase [Pseudomonadota bacterium]
MHSFVKYIIQLFRGGPGLDPVDLQATFQQHFKVFRSLLTANNNALKLMAEMEQTLNSGRSFGMAFVRGNCTALTANVYKMVINLVELADGRYESIIPRFKEISLRIENTIASRPIFSDLIQPFVLPLSEIDRHSVDAVGEKMANLGEIRKHLGLNTPDGFVITAEAARHFITTNNLQDEINRRLKQLNEDDLEDLFTVSAAVQNLIVNSRMPEDLDSQINQAYYQLAVRQGREILVSMRSSASGEDLVNTSFAGQYRTQLDVHPDFLGHTYKEILAGKYKSQALVYRLRRGYRHQDIVMCVGCLMMIDATVSGVSYSNAGSNLMHIYAVAGTAANVVEGEAPCDVYHLNRQQPFPIVFKSPGVTNTPDNRQTEGVFLLSDEQIQELAQATLLLEKHFGGPQDIEWSFDSEGKLVILQSRPLDSETFQATALASAGDDQNTDAAICPGGIAVSRGIASGPVFKVESQVDLLQFPRGAVLLVRYPHSDWAVLVSHAVAIISAAGEAAAHLATVAREFGVPAIFGVEDAFSTYNDGEILTVDAIENVICRGKDAERIARSQPAVKLMVGSPVYKILQRVLQEISPLNLTDPKAVQFAPSYCRTLHDITRFCHEKAVQEIFQFGMKYRFDKRSAKQLVVKTPFQWWVINLDDGFSENVQPESKYVSLDDIQSEPMHAVWRGMVAVPWEGPPPVNLRGFGSIILQSTMDPRLEPAVGASMGGRNYFLVSRNFCNLSVRLGYHFALVEANLGEFLTENYISFQFKGGAADERRRLVRVTLLAEILRLYGFRVDLIRDALTARLEKYPAAYLKDRLALLGYLLIHTRQIDMVLGEEAILDRYKRKIMADLANIMDKAHDEEKGNEKDN